VRRKKGNTETSGEVGYDMTAVLLKIQTSLLAYYTVSLDWQFSTF